MPASRDPASVFPNENVVDEHVDFAVCWHPRADADFPDLATIEALGTVVEIVEWDVHLMPLTVSDVLVHVLGELDDRALLLVGAAREIHHQPQIFGRRVGFADHDPQPEAQGVVRGPVRAGVLRPPPKPIPARAKVPRAGGVELKPPGPVEAFALGHRHFRLALGRGVTVSPTLASVLLPIATPDELLRAWRLFLTGLAQEQERHRQDVSRAHSAQAFPPW